jgi:DNA invertase Pin-like site-specific DNA recombinase
MKVAIYTRVSGRSNRQDAENQRIALRQWCEREGHTIIEYSDRMTGTSSKRQAFLQMMKDANAKKFDMLLFWSLDRLSREGVLKTLQYLKRLDDIGILWKSHMEPYLDSTGMFRDAVIAILAAVAKAEHARIQERLAAAREKMRRQGRRWGRPCKIYDRAKVKELSAAGMSIRQIAAELGVSAGAVFYTLRPKPAV